MQTRIPEIKEWFLNLSLDDRVLCLTNVDPFFAQSIIRMQTKNAKHGQGVFRLVSTIIQESPALLKNPNEADNF